MIAMRRGNPDWVLLGSLLLLLGLGVAMVYSASANYAELRWKALPSHFLLQHLARIAVGAVVFLGAYLAPYRAWTRAGRWIFILALVLMLFLQVSGSVGAINGAKRWISLASFSLQPSEMAKLGLILVLSRQLAELGPRIEDFANGFLPVFLRVGLVFFMILAQPNYSTAVAVLCIGIAMLFTAGMRLRHLGVMALAGFPLLLWIMISSPYRMKRVLGFLNPEEHAASGHQALQALVALGHGGFAGTGLGRGTSKLLYLPEPYTDTVFAILGEELGLLGTAVVLGLFVLVAWRGFRAALSAPDGEGRLLATGFTVALALYALLHAMVCTKLIPTTGLPMPFISYGGSSLTFSLAAAGFLLNVSSCKPVATAAQPVARPRTAEGRTLWA